MNRTASATYLKLIQKRLGLIILLTFAAINSFGQVCTGALGDPVVKIDFGSGSSEFGPALSTSVTNYTYSSGTPEDGQYTISKSTNGMHNSSVGWYQISNHTPGDPNGYMMVVNANNNPGLFYQTTVTGLCPNTTYEFGAWIINILNYSGIKPNITFAIYDTSGNLLSNPFNTGDIPESGGWKPYALTFRTPANITDIVLKMINNGPGGNGNDIALDDITFRACGPTITPSIDAATGQQASLCEGKTKDFLLSAQVGSGYNIPEFQWQQMVNSAWVNLPGEVDKQLTVKYINAIPGTAQYRLLVAETGSISSASCRTTSPVYTLIVNPLTALTPESNSPVCLGQPLQLTSNEGAAYSWTGPNGFVSSERSPVISNSTTAMAGTYELTLTNASGCQMTAQTVVQIDQPPVAAVTFPEATVCEGTGILLGASGGATYQWSPAAGLSATNIPDPMATPSETTTYTVTVSNGSCESTATVNIIVNKAAAALAGPDRTIMEGQSAVLNGTVSGDNVNYYWTPADHLDDPTKLNPVATPAEDMVYTLNVISTAGCSDSFDEVFVKVYKKVIIQNTFSPNGDGVNDTWKIVALDAYPKSMVSVFNRNGGIVFNSKGYQFPWDGKYKGTILPAGVYYYTIYLDEINKPLSGWVTIIK